MLSVFDLDDTLVRYGKNITVPRQTFHILRDLHLKGYKIAVISYNPLGKIIIQRLGLSKYVDYSICSSTSYRAKLISSLIPLDENIHYYDDRKDNLEAVKEKYPEVITHHVENSLTLYKVIKDSLNVRL